MTHLSIFTLGSVRSSPPSVRYQHFVRFLHRSDVDEIWIGLCRTGGTADTRSVTTTINGRVGIDRAEAQNYEGLIHSVEGYMISGTGYVPDFIGRGGQQARMPAIQRQVAKPRPVINPGPVMILDALSQAQNSRN